MCRFASLAFGSVLMATASLSGATETFVTQFERVYGTSGSDSGFSVIETADGGFLAIGRGSGLSMAVKTDANGELQWQYQYSDPSASLALATAVQTAGGGYVLGGSISPSSRPGSLGSRDAMLLGLDAGGVEQWRTVFGGSDADALYTIKLAGDGSIVATGPTLSPEIPGAAAGARQIYVVHASATGTVLKEAAFQIAMTGYEEGFDLVQTPDGGFMVTGMAEFPKGWFLLRLDADMNRLWGGLYGTADIQTIVNNGTGGFLAAGTIGTTAHAHAILVQLDAASADPSDPVVIRSGWPKTYVREDFDIYTIFYRADVTADGGIIAAGVHYLLTNPPDPASEESRVWVVKLDEDGVIVREGLYGRRGARGVYTTSDGGYAVVGTATDFPGGPGGNDLYLLKLIDSINPGAVEGTVWFDSDATCSQTAGDIGAPQRLVRLVNDETDAAFLTMSRTDGSYAAILPPGDYEATLAVSAISQEPETCGPSGQSYALSVASDQTVAGKDFFGGCQCGVSQTLTGHAIDPMYDCPSGVSTTPCFGYPWEICYGVTNLCNPLHHNPGGGGNFVKTCVNLPPNTAYAGPPSITTSNCGGSGTWVLQSISPAGQVCFELDNNTNFPPGCHADLCFPITVDAAFTGGTFAAQFSTNQCTGSDAIPAAAPLSYSSECACDPNAMHVSPEGCGAEGSITGQELTYRIDFQNLGAGAAHDVVITDALDSDLDPATIRLLDASHTITGFQIGDDGELQVRFDDIELPPEVLDAAGSQGRVTFAISPLAPFVDGTVIENGASIVFDTNAPVATNVVINTLYAGDPVPVVDFSATPDGSTLDFAYTGGTTGAALEWDFGPNASPRTSADASPSDIAFASPGQTPVLLRATKAGCSAEAARSVEVPCDAFWTTTPFESPMGGRPRRLGSRVTLKLRLSYEGLPVDSQADLEQILNDDFDRDPEGDCWPRVRVFDENDDELALGADDFAGSQPNPQGCFRFRRSGLLTLKLKLRQTLFERDAAYRVAVQNFTCGLMPGNGEFRTRP